MAARACRAGSAAAAGCALSHLEGKRTMPATFRFGLACLETRRNNYDVTNRVETTDPASVSREVSRMFVELYPDASTQPLERSFADVARLYRGEYPGYRACDTGYHNLQHTLDVTLAMARLMDGYERTRDRAEAIGSRRFAFGIVAALLHDIGYLRRINDTRHENGAEYTLKHVSRGAKFIEHYMEQIGMPELALVAGQIVHFTGYERTVDRIMVPNLMFRMLGNMLGTADIIAQMADRCYLEKCRDRLFPEFVAGGLAAKDEGDRRRSVLFRDVQDLLLHTPQFYKTATLRLKQQLGGAYGYAQRHFGGQNLYIEEIDKNIHYAEEVAEQRDLSLLRRTPPSPRSDDDS
ncbi:MAG TPA: HD domain-containing protein [Burkholderiales bacterium]|nr:HD domain-containing protein [Burkholderiales bacterium]